MPEPAAASGPAPHHLQEGAPPRRLAAVGCGLITGLFSGIFGVGGGILVVPALVLLLHMDQRRAHGTSLAAVIPISLTGVIGYAVQGSVDGLYALFLIAGAGVGTLFGTRLLHVAPSHTLRLGFAALLFVTALRLALPTTAPSAHHELTTVGAVGLVVLGIGSGVLSGLFGVGGGVVIVPALVLFFDLTDVVAKGTSLLVVLPTAVLGTIANARRGNVDLGTALLVGVPGAAVTYPGVQISAHLSHFASTATFALLLLALSVRMATLRERPAQEAVTAVGD